MYSTDGWYVLLYVVTRYVNTPQYIQYNMEQYYKRQSLDL